MSPPHLMYNYMLGGSLVATAWRVLRLRMEKTASGLEDSWEYIEHAVADSRQEVVFQIGGWAWS
jgi:hypothetical protein